MFKNISHLLEGVKVKIRGEDSNTSRTVKIQVIPSGILTDMVKESLNPRGYKECTKVMDEEGEISITADPRKNDPIFQELGRFGDPHCITEDGKDCIVMYVMYKITCNLCQQSVNNDSKRSREPGKHESENYIGMTMTSFHCRMVSHLSG